MSTDFTLHVDAKCVSPWALTAFAALEEKGLPYRLATRDLDKRETFLPDFGARTQRIPALQRGDFWLAESTAIAEYLAENFPFPKHPRLYPEDLSQRATCRELQGWYRTDLMPLRQERPTSTVWGPRATTPLSEAAKAAALRLINVLAPLIQERTTLFDAWSIADVDTAIMLQRLNLNGDELPANLKRYAEVNWQRPSVAKWNALPR